MIRIYAMLALGLLFIFCLVVLFGSIYAERNRRKVIESELGAAREKRNNVWKEADATKDMVALYLNMVAKHGVDSEEAQAFRFGTDSPLMKSLHADNDARTAFIQQADIIDEACRKIRRKK